MMKRQNKGFSFTELVIAVLLLSIGLLPIFWFFSRTNVGTQKTRDEVLAWQYAAELIDYSIARGFAGNELTDTNGVEVREITVGSEKTSIENKFTRRLFVRPLAPEHNSAWPCRYHSITSEVSWMAESQQRNIKLTGLLYAP